MYLHRRVILLNLGDKMLKHKPINMNSKRSINLIVDTMLRLLKDKKFSEITISELTKEAGVVRNTFYAHFECKEDVLMHHMFSTFSNRIELTMEDKTAHELDFALMYFDIWLENLEFLNILKNNKLLHFLSQFGDQFNLICEQTGMFDDCSVSVEAKDYANPLYADALASIVKQWMKTGQKETPVGLSRIFKEFIR